MSLQDQYGENVRQAQEAWVKAVETWTSGVQTAFSRTGSDDPFGTVDPTTVIDQYFDLAQKTLEAQREVAKNLAKGGQAIGQRLREQAESAAQAAPGQADSTQP
jgi:hypothetical protein